MGRALKYLLCLAIAVAVALVSIPWWLGAVGGPVGRRLGFTFGRYQRVGYARFRLEDVRLVAGPVSVSALRVETETPLVALWHLARGAARPAVVDGWRVAVADHGPSHPDTRKPGAVDGFPGLHGLLQRVARELRRWLPAAELHDGAVRWRAGGLTVAGVDWSGGRLTLRELRFLGQKVDGTVDPGEPWAVALQGRAAGEPWQALVHWSGAAADGNGTIGGQAFRVRARFPEDGWLPAEGEAAADHWDFPAGKFDLGKEYDRVRGGGGATWRDGELSLTAEAGASPAKGAEAPPVDGRLEVRGTRAGFKITRLHLASPFAVADLTAPIQLDFQHGFNPTPARLTVQADLARQRWLEARGRVQGVAVVSAAATGSPRLEFQVDGSDLYWRGLEVAKAALRGGLRWPRLEVAAAELSTGGGSRVTASGQLDLQALTLANVVVQADMTARDLKADPWAAQFGKSWLRDLDWQQLKAEVRLDGPWRSLRHAGTVEIARLQAAPLKPADLAADWRGHGAAVETLTLRAKAGASTLTLAAAGNAQGATVRELALTVDGTQAWRLTGPAAIAWSPRWRVAGVRIEGRDGLRFTCDADGGDAPSLALAARHLNLAWCRDWLTIPGPAWRVDELKLTGQVKGGRPGLVAQLAGTIWLNAEPLQVSLDANADADAVRLAEFRLADRGRPLLRAAGKLPWSWDAQAPLHWRVDPARPVELAADTENDPALWSALGASLGLVVNQPVVHVHVGGSLAEPAGEVRVAAARLALAPGSEHGTFPDLTDLVLNLRIDRRKLSLVSLAGRIEGQSVSAQGELPMTGERWRELWSRPAALDWRLASGRVEAARVDLAQLARRIPALPLAEGRGDARVTLAPGGRLDGELRVADATTRPVEPLGILQNVSGEVALTGRRVEIRSLKAELGGQPVTLSGSVDLPERGGPRLDLALRGSDLPLVRRDGLLVRADLALQAKTEAAGPTRVTGVVTVRECLVLADLTALLPTGQRGVASRPPYFAVPLAPYNRWPLAVEIRGPKSVQLRTAVFAGTASPHFQLTGTLGEPRAVGEVAVDQGQVFFPFATFNVQLGSVRLSEADPYRPQVNVTAVSLRQDYELRLEVTGTPDEPNVRLSSNPPLPASQVLLLVTTGQPPTSGAAGAASSQQRLAGIGAYLGKGLMAGLGGGDESRLTITSGNQVSEEGRATYEVDYRLGARWTLVGEYDQFDDYNADLKWRMYQKGGRDEKR